MVERRAEVFAQLKALYQYTKFQFESGSLYQYRTLCTNSEWNLSALWGKFVVEILMQNRDAALVELNQLKSLFIFFNNDNGRTQIIDLLHQKKYINVIQTNALHLVRYLATTLGRTQFREFIKVIQQEQNSYKDPITGFLACVYVNFDFDGAQKKMLECEDVIMNDLFLGKGVEEGSFSTVCLRDVLLENARFFIFETYCKIHQDHTNIGLLRKTKGPLLSPPRYGGEKSGGCCPAQGAGGGSHTSHCLLAER